MSPNQPSSRPTAPRKRAVNPKNSTTTIQTRSAVQSGKANTTQRVAKRAVQKKAVQKSPEKISQKEHLARRLENLIKLVQRSDLSYNKVNIEFLDQHLELEKYNTETIISAITFLKDKVITLGKASKQNVSGKIYRFDDRFQSIEVELMNLSQDFNQSLH